MSNLRCKILLCSIISFWCIFTGKQQQIVGQYLDFDPVSPSGSRDPANAGNELIEPESGGSQMLVTGDLGGNQENNNNNNNMNTLQEPRKLKTLHIAGFFPMTGTGGWIGGSGCLPAAMMALDDVNARTDLLPGYRLELSFEDSQCNPGKAARYMYEMIYHPPKKVILVCGCSTVCSIVAESANMWNLIVVGYGSSSPALSDRSRFPTFFRTHPSATIHNPTRIKLFQKYGWSRVAIILETEEVFIETAKDLEQKCRLQNIQLLTRVSFVRQPSDAMDNLKRADPRIIVGMFYKQQARRVMCEAYKRGLYGDKYVWFLIGWYEDDWWTDTKDLDCTYEQMKLAVEGHITTEALVRGLNDRPTFSGFTFKNWLNRYNKELAKRARQGQLPAVLPLSLTYTSSSQSTIMNNDLANLSLPAVVDKVSTGVIQQQQQPTVVRPEGYQEAPLAYDAIWAIALALNSTIRELDSQNLSLERFNYTDTLHIKDVFLKQLRLTNFQGVSGEVAFSDIGDRIAWTQIEQMIDGNYTVIGYFDSKNDYLDFKEDKIRWPRGEPPKDRTIIRELVEYLSLPYMITIILISLLGILTSACLIYFNWANRDDPLIRMSHPPSNNIMLFGCIVCLTSVILFGLDGRFIPKENFYLICDLRAWFLNIGFSLFFGSMFWKVWQSYLLSTRNIAPPGKSTANQRVLTTVGSFCLIDVIILTCWKLYEPMDRTTVKIKEQSGSELNMGDDVIVELKIEYCEAKFFWYYLIFCYKGLLLVFGLFLAYETRGVKLRQLNDSKLVGMCIYNVAIMCFITGPVSLVNLMRQQANYHYLFVSITIIFCCSLSKILIFIPKVAEFLRRRKRRRTSGGAGWAGALANPSSASMHEEASSRDDEEQLIKLEKENRELMEKIREKDSQMKAMIARIEEARERANKSLEESRAAAAAASVAANPSQNNPMIASHGSISTLATSHHQNQSQPTASSSVNMSLRGRRGMNQD